MNGARGLHTPAPASPQTTEFTAMTMTNEEAQAQMILAQHGREMDKITEVGRTTYGEKPFDDACADVVQRLSDNRPKHEAALQYGAIVKEFDDPAGITMHLANNPDTLEKIKKMTPTRQLAELAAIQGQLHPHGVVNLGADPAWKTSGRGFRNGGDDYPSTADGDEAWSKAWDARERARYPNRVKTVR